MVTKGSYDTSLVLSRVGLPEMPMAGDVERHIFNRPSVKPYKIG